MCEQPQCDGNRLSQAAGWTTSGLYSLATPLHLQSVSRPPLPCFLSSFSSFTRTTTTTTANPHPRLLLCMNNAGGLLDRRYQHATACFIHTKVRQISPSPLPRSSSRPMASKTSASARRVRSLGLSLTHTSLQGRATTLL